MNELMNCALLISTYNWPSALDLVLATVVNQTKIPFEVVIADDGSNEDTFEVIKKYQNLLNVKHIWHEDNGFRKTIIMNKAIQAVTQKYIVQIDGDMLLHPHFIEDHLRFAKHRHFIKGSRAMLLENTTSEVLRSKEVDFLFLRNNCRSKINATRAPVFAPFFFGNKKRTNNLRGCNFAFWKDDFIAVNGYNNDLTGWGHEDIELASRMVNHGVYRRQLKMVAVCFHLFHKLNKRDMENKNFAVYEETVKRGTSYATNGFSKSNS